MVCVKYPNNNNYYTWIIYIHTVIYKYNTIFSHKIKITRNTGRFTFAPVYYVMGNMHTLLYYLAKSLSKVFPLTRKVN